MFMGAMRGINHVKDEVALHLPFVQKNRRKRVVSQNALNEFCAISLRPHRLSLKSRLKVQMPKLKQILKIQNALRRRFVSGDSVVLHLLLRRREVLSR